MIKDKVPKGVLHILSKLSKNGYESYIIGGCVRDILLNKEPHDWDITTNATPDEIEKVFPLTYPTGKQYGTITVGYMDGKDLYTYEVTTYRKDGNYTDGRRPDKVTWGDSLEEDVKRRDFTINALAWSPETGVIDYVHGLDDLMNHVIRAIGNPKERFKEDALRTVRAIRFSMSLVKDKVFDIEYNTKNALIDAILFKNCLDKIAKERIYNEIMKMLPYISTYKFDENNSIISSCLIEILGVNSRYDFDREYSPDLTMYHLYKNDVNKMVELKFTNTQINYVKSLNKCMDLWKENYGLDMNIKIRLLLSKVDKDIVKDFYYVVSKDEDFSDMSKSIWYNLIEENNQYCTSLKELNINGDDLLNLNIEPKKIGGILNNCLKEVLYKPNLNKKELLLNIVKDIGENKNT